MLYLIKGGGCMSTKIFECNDTGIIIEKDYYYPAQFSTVKKYSILYIEELPRFRKQPLNIYGLPFFDEPIKNYNGIGRMGLSEFDPKKNILSKAQKKIIKKVERSDEIAEKLMLNEEKAEMYLNLFRDSDSYELIWTRMSFSNEPIPCRYQFIGYDICFPPYRDGAFSIICDCMFICRWHGCDEEGTLFADNFSKLNANGLFDSWQDAYDYMIKYLEEDWSERGEYGIFEIYKRQR